MSAYAPHKYNPWEMPAEELEATFIGRQTLLDRLLEGVREQTHAGTIQHYILLGPRGIGKTSLLLLLRRRLKKDPELSPRWLCVHFREEEFYVYTLRDLFALALESLGADENVAEAKAIVDEAQAEADDEKSEAILLAGLRRICAARGQRILLLIDNLDQFLRTLPRRDEVETFQHALRRLLSTDHFLMVIGTSTRQFEEVFPFGEPQVHTGPVASYEEAFFNFFCPMPVGNLSDDEVDALLIARARFDDNRDFIRDYERHKANIRTITFLTGGNPRIVLMLYEILSQHRILPVVQALRQTVDNLTPLFKDVLEQMSRQQSKALDAVMRLGGAGSPTDIAATARLRLNVVTTMLGRLKEGGFLASEGEGKGRPATYRVRDQMFRTWYQMRYLRPARRRLELLADLLRAWFTATEREGALERLHGEFQRELADGLPRRARETALTMEYYAASLEDRDARIRAMELVADAYLSTGDMHQAAMTLDDACAEVGESQAHYEAGCYLRLGSRLLGKDEIPKAMQAFSEAAQRNPKDAGAHLGLGICLAKTGEDPRAVEELTIASEDSETAPEIRAGAFLVRAGIKAAAGSQQESIADYSRVIELPGVPKEMVAEALLKRGVAKREVGLPEAAIADLSAFIQLCDAPTEELAEALFERALAKVQLGDLNGAVEDNSSVVELDGVSDIGKAKALLNRGGAKRMLGDQHGAIEDFSAAIARSGARNEDIAGALFNRGAAKRDIADQSGAIADFSAVIEMPDAPIEDLAKAYTNRGIARSELGDEEGSLDDFAAVIELPGAPDRWVAFALHQRADQLLDKEDFVGGLRDLSALINMRPEPAEILSDALFQRGLVSEYLGKSEAALADYLRCVEMRCLPKQVHGAIHGLARLLCRIGNTDEAAAWATRMDDLEPDGIAMEERLGARIGLVVTVAREASLDAAGMILAALLKTRDEGLRERLSFLAPGLELARTGDEAVLAKLPEAEREAAKRIAASIKEKAAGR